MIVFFTYMIEGRFERWHGPRDGPKDGLRDSPQDGFRDGPRDGPMDGPKGGPGDGTRVGPSASPSVSSIFGPRDAQHSCALPFLVLLLLFDGVVFNVWRDSWSMCAPSSESEYTATSTPPSPP